ncbi:hypothetical protein GCM10020219_046870 [Nonomuraea dietziae]
MFVVTPSTAADPSALSSDRSAEERSSAHAITFDSIGSKSLPTTSPSVSEESTLTSEGSRRASTRPPVGRKPRAGSSA